LPANAVAAPYMMKILALSGIEVIGIGPEELMLGREELIKLSADSPVHLVAANLPGFLPYVRLRKNDGRLRVLVSSVIDPGVLQHYKIGYDGPISDPVAALSRLQREISHDFFIVIVHALDKRVVEIISECPGVDLALDGMTLGAGEHNLDGKTGVPLVFDNKRGQYVSYLDYRPDREPRLSTPVRLRASVGMVKEDPQIKSMTDAYIREKQLYHESMREQAFHREMMDKEFNLYLGGQACQHCHAQSYRQWAVSPHAEAFKSLSARGRGADQDCLKCHVTGMGDSGAIGGFTSIEESPWMVNVQCEACHGAGAEHAQKPLRNQMKKVTTDICLRCHTEASDPEFDFAKRWLMIEHGKGEKGGEVEN